MPKPNDARAEVFSIEAQTQGAKASNLLCLGPSCPNANREGPLTSSAMSPNCIVIFAQILREGIGGSGARNSYLGEYQVVLYIWLCLVKTNVYIKLRE